MFRVASKATGIIGLLAARAFCACGGDSEGSGVKSGVNGSQPVNMLATSDVQNLCNAVASYGASRITPDAVKHSVCVGLTAIQVGGTPPTVAECNDSVTKCMMMGSPPTGGTTPSAVPACMGGALPTACTATVGEVETCSTALIDQAASAFTSVSCDLWGLPPADAAMRLMQAQNRPVPAECAPIQQKCPVFLGQATQTASQ